MNKKYDVGFYGGKFIPFHKGHLFCTDIMAKECKKGYLIMFIGGDQEVKILNNIHDENLLPKSRWEVVKRVASMYENITPVIIDVTDVKLEDGTEDWDGETPLVRAVCGDKIDAVYSSEISYGEYFSRAYPEAAHRLVDPPRLTYPISATKIRNMKNEKEREKWIM